MSSAASGTPSIPSDVEHYLESNIFPVLRVALADLFLLQPASPFAWLGTRLLECAPRESTDADFMDLTKSVIPSLTTSASKVHGTIRDASNAISGTATQSLRAAVLPHVPDTTLEEYRVRIASLIARIQDLEDQLAVYSASSMSQLLLLPTNNGHGSQAALHLSSAAASSSPMTAVDPSESSFLKCMSAVVSGLKRRDTEFLRQVFERHMDGSCSLPASSLVLALTEADAPVIPESEAAAARTVARFDSNINGLLEFGEFERTVNVPDELTLYFQEKRQPLLADALRALVGPGGDQLLRVSKLSPSDMRAAHTAVRAILPQQAESLFKELQRSFAAQFDIQAQMAAGAIKFNVVKMACGGIEDFHEGLTGRIGMPHLKFMDAMRQEHCEKAGCNTSFTTGNYQITTTSRQEWLYIAGDEKGQQVACLDMDHGRRIVPITELMKLKLAVDAKLTEVEMLAVVLYTGPMFQVYNCILRRFPAELFTLFHDGGNLYATTIFVLVSAVQKISRCTRIPEGTLLYRGLGGLLDLPDKFHAADEQGRTGYLDWGMMSTTSDRDVALGYSGVKQRRPRATVMVIEATSVDRGADISEFSQYPLEKEFLWVPCSFVQRLQAGAGRVEVVDGGLVSFVPVRVNLNLKTETVDALLEKKKSMHIAGFEFRVNELKQRLQDDAKAGNADARLKKDKSSQGKFWKKVYTVDGYIEAQVKKVEAVLETHRVREAADYCDDAVYRSLVAESLEAVSMALSALQWWLRDESERIHNIEDDALLLCQRGFESFLRLRYARAASAEERRAAALELCKARNLISTDICEEDGNGEQPLEAMAARGASGEDVFLLVAAGCDVGAVVNGATPLFIASQSGHASVVEALLARGADVNQGKTNGTTPLFIASQSGHVSVVEALLAQGAVFNQASTDTGATPLFIASQSGHVSVVEALLARGADVNQAKTNGTTPLFISSQNGHVSVVEALLARGANVNKSKADDGGTPLFIASQHNHTSVVEALLVRGADVNQTRTDNGATPLFIASQQGHTSVVESLLARGANVNQARSDTGATPLFIASQLGHAVVVEALLARGADVNQAKTNGATPLFISSQNGHVSVVEAVLARGANVNKSKADDGATPLFIASQHNHASVVEALLVRGADVNQARTDNGTTPLFIASQNGHVSVVEALLAHGADVDQAKTNGSTPLFIASQNGHVSVVEALLARGADVNQANADDGTTPLSMASQNGHANIVEALLARGADRKLLDIAFEQACEHAAAMEFHRTACSVIVRRHRGGGVVTSDYQLRFQGFNTFVADVRLCGRCFYFEVHVVDIVRVMQFGVCTQGFEPSEHSKGIGTGDDAFSWAIDGARLQMWHKGSSQAYGSKWAAGDVIGIVVDMRIAGCGILSASVNGSFAAPNGAAFSNIAAPFLSPALSGDGRYCVNFGERPFVHAPPDAEHVSVHAFHRQQH